MRTTRCTRQGSLIPSRKDAKCRHSKPSMTGTPTIHDIIAVVASGFAFAGPGVGGGAGGTITCNKLLLYIIAGAAVFLGGFFRFRGCSCL